ncbi:N-acetyl-alpha-D-glucosaminyl L-malate synthase BshA [Flavobacteriaceae bacterium]|nr:N-acetyl-alpha-D-glucosaminyl L-malate synthase BshA [Flavobacteriales bacterium]MBL6877803.1 N-acetyl-alpha-D-glucosaminyl L-malate synthase BshA [Flavobacteriaceae bacterium]MDA8625951.1 N-acetyl-alpha-D-glucosaminyl L-malate synthase BshA [Flavobacteriaceae bacterium]MDA9550543.1 N-acetyl-alpha-D-glucosaminyl L-malate synthase BshA [Flavobacteriaceae bacterium]MDA9849335.1 N-acetyl-alpha-D-glucosaminyl L-malate synthase BshA [Flavobacteriaceae bacterium]
MIIGIVCYPTYGGSGVVATELGLELSKRGHEVHFITYNQPVKLNLFNNNIHYHEVIVPDYPLFHYQPYELALSSKIVDMVQLHKIDILHVHYAIPHAYAAYMSKQMLKTRGINLPIVTTLHGTDITLVGSHPYYKNAVEFSINNSDAVTSVSKDLKRDTLSFFNIKKNIEVIPNFVDLEKYIHVHENCNRGVLANKDEKIITHISNFRKVKRIDDVINSFNLINKEINSKLILLGDGPERIKAEKLCDELNLNEKVLFLGASNETAKILCLSDVFILASTTESFGLVALEAMASSVPVVSTNSGGLPEVNKNGFSGYLSDVGDINTMAKNAIKILKDSTKLINFKKNAKQQANKFDVHNIVPHYEDIYKRTLSKQS